MERPDWIERMPIRNRIKAKRTTRMMVVIIPARISIDSIIASNPGGQKAPIQGARIYQNVTILGQQSYNSVKSPLAIFGSLLSAAE